MDVTSVCIVLLLVTWQVLAAPHTDGENTVVNNKLTPSLSNNRENWTKQNKDAKYKNTVKGFLSKHNEVQLEYKDISSISRDDSISADTDIVPSSTPKPSEKSLLSDWIRSIPRDIFNMRNRMKLATIFLEAHSRDDVLDKLANAGGNLKKRHDRRRMARRRRVKKIWPVAYHPIARFKYKRGSNPRFSP